MSAPTNVSLVSTGDITLYTVTLSWDPIPGVDGFRVYGSKNGGPTNIVAADGGEASGTTFAVYAAGEYVFTVTSVAGGVESPPSDPVSVTVGGSASAGISQVRALIPDLDPNNRLFTDAEIQTFLDIYRGNVRRAAAAAIDAVAVNEALLYKIVRTDDLQVNGVSGAEVLRKRAQGLRDEADKDDTIAGDEALIIVYPEVQRIVPEGTPAPYTGNWGRTWIPWG